METDFKILIFSHFRYTEVLLVSPQQLLRIQKLVKIRNLWICDKLRIRGKPNTSFKSALIFHQKLVKSTIFEVTIGEC